MRIRQRLLSVFASGMALSVCAIAAAESPAAIAPGAVAPGAVAPGAVAPGAVAPGDVAPAALQTTAVVSTSPLPAANKIWECTTKGVRTFSSNPCGMNPTVRELNPINVMEPAPMYRVTHTYAPPPAQRSDYVYSNQAASDATSDNAYSAYAGYVMVTRSHRAHPNSGRSHPHPHH